MLVKVGEHEWHMEKDLVDKLEQIKAQLRRNNNYVMIIDGNTGEGKTTLACQIAKYVDPNFDSHNLYYDGDEYIKGCIYAGKYSAVVYDEAYRDWSSTRVMSSMSHRLNAMMMEIRQNNLFHIIVLPSFFDLNKTMAIFGSDSLIHVCRRSGNRIGGFKYFHRPLKKYLYIQGKKFYNYAAAKRLIRGTFGPKMPINEEAYLVKKKEMLQRLMRGEEKTFGPQAKKQMIERNAFVAMLKIHCGWSFTKMAEEYKIILKREISPSNIGVYYKNCMDLVEESGRTIEDLR